MLPLVCIIAILALWGPFAPVPFTNVNPHESVVGRIISAIKAILVAKGAYELVIRTSRKVVGSAWYEADIYSPYDEFANFVPPTPAFEGYIPPVPVVSEVSSDWSVRFGGPAFGAGLLTFFLGCCLVFGPLIAYALRNPLARAVRGLFVPSTKVANHFVTGVTATVNSASVVVLQPTSAAYDAVVAMIESTRGLGQSGVSLIHAQSTGVLFFTDSVSSRGARASTWVRTQSQPMEFRLIFDKVSFHPVVDMAINRLERQRNPRVILELGFCMDSAMGVRPIVAACPTTPESHSPRVPVPDSGLLPQSRALVLRRLENISHFVLFRLTLVLLALLEGGQFTAPDQVGPKDEEALTRPKRKRPGQKARRRLLNRDLRQRQAELVGTLEEQSSESGPATQSQPPSSPVPASQAEQTAAMTAAPMVSLRPSAPIFALSNQGAGRAVPPFQPPPPQHIPNYGARARGGYVGQGVPVFPPQPHQRAHHVGARGRGGFMGRPVPPYQFPPQPTFFNGAQGRGGNVPPFPGQYQQYAPPEYLDRWGPSFG